jgi:hypothetical protein
MDDAGAPTQVTASPTTYISTEKEKEEEVKSDTDILLDLARRDDVNEQFPLTFFK